MKRTKEAGMNAHLSKPLDIGIMVQTLGTEFEKESYRKMAFHDSLTGLYNRHYLAQWQEIHAANPIYPVSFVSVDANDLKKVNDNFSHNAGDLLLKTVGDSLSEVFPQDKSIVARTGGDEFLVLCKGCDHETVLGFVEQARKMARDKVLSITGGKDSKLSAFGDVTVKLPKYTPFEVQELTLPVYHALCAAVEAEFFGE